MTYRTAFDPERALAATAYFAHHTGDTMYPILKMIYLADRLHLERYGRPITGDSYSAMKEGPTPSEIYDWMKFLRGSRQYSSYPEAKQYLRVDASTHDVSVLKMPELDVLSASDLECINAVLEVRQQSGSRRVVDMSHDEAWKATTRNKRMDVMTIAGTLRDGPLVTQHLSERFPEK